MALPNCILFTGDKVVRTCLRKRLNLCFFGWIGECRTAGYIVNLHYFCGRLIIAPTAVIVDFAAVFIIFRRNCYCCFGGIGECRPTKSGVRSWKKVGQNRHTICEIIKDFETADEIEKNGVGNAYMRSVELRFVAFSRATGYKDLPRKRQNSP